MEPSERPTAPWRPTDSDAPTLHPGVELGAYADALASLRGARRGLSVPPAATDPSLAGSATRDDAGSEAAPTSLDAVMPAHSPAPPAWEPEVETAASPEPPRRSPHLGRRRVAVIAGFAGVFLLAAASIAARYAYAVRADRPSPSAAGPNTASEGPSVVQPASMPAGELEATQPRRVEAIAPVRIPAPPGATANRSGERPAAGEGAPSRRPRRTRTASDEPGRDAPPLDAAAVRRVVHAEQPRLRQCYTTALRRAGAPSTVRATMTVEIGADGFVRDVEVSGADIDGLPRCLRRTAIQWVFPASREGGRVPIPLAFHPTT